MRRAEQLKLDRMRIRYCKEAHGYLRNRGVQESHPECMLCNQHVLAIKHLLGECEAVHNVRHLYINKRYPTTEELLVDNRVHKQLFYYVKRIDYVIYCNREKNEDKKLNRKYRQILREEKEEPLEKNVNE